MKHPRILIVGTVPYNVKSTSRAFESYFANWEKENLAQVFSHPKKPCKGHCGSFYQITDQRLFKKRFKKDVAAGVTFEDKDLPEEWLDNSLEIGSKTAKKIYTKKNRKTAFWHLVRKSIWKEKYWNTKHFNEWLDSFGPQAVFLSFSNDFFILEIALYVAQKYDIPLISSTGDDYYFNTVFSLSPFYRIYKKKYKKLVEKVFAYPGDTIYIGDKIRDKYNEHFKISGKTLYLTSYLERKPFRKIDKDNLKVAYFGNIMAGRNESLAEIGNVLGKINPNYHLDIYSNENSKKIVDSLDGKPGIRYHGSIPYKEVLKKIHENDIIIIVEGMKKKDILNTKYSLSTKVADSLASGTFILAYGSRECGAMQYLQDTHAALVVTDRGELKEAIENAINDIDYQKQCYDQAIIKSNENHVLEKSLARFEKVVAEAIATFKETKHTNQN